jgi:hypothetical protein
MAYLTDVLNAAPAVRDAPGSTCTNGDESMHLRASSHTFVHAANAEELRAATAVVTRAIAAADERDEVLKLVRERAALRRELDVAERVPLAAPSDEQVA